MSKLKRPKDLNGPAGLFAAVFMVAVEDALEGEDPDRRADAWRYLASPQFDRHLEMAGLEPGMVPQDIEELANASH